MDTLPPAATPAPRGLASIADTGSFLKISRVCIYQHTRAGHLRAVKLGRAVRYSWEELERVARDGLPALRKTAPASIARTSSPGPEAPPQSAKRRPGRPRKSAGLMGKGGTPC